MKEITKEINIMLNDIKNRINLLENTLLKETVNNIETIQCDDCYMPEEKRNEFLTESLLLALKHIKLVEHYTEDTLRKIDGKPISYPIQTQPFDQTYTFTPSCIDIKVNNN